MLFLKIKKSFEHIDNKFLRLLDLISCIKSHIKRNLVVTATPCMHLLAGIADPVYKISFYEAMYIFIFSGDHKLTTLNICHYRIKSLEDRLFIFICDDSLLGKHCYMSSGASYICLQEPFIKRYRCIKIPGKLVCFTLKTATPKLCHMNPSCIFIHVMNATLSHRMRQCKFKNVYF